MPNQKIPSNVTIFIRADESVSNYTKRALSEAARVTGLPLLEQKLFADALLAKYPGTSNRSWTNDPTPSDKDSTVRTSDFNYLLLKQYLNEHPKAGGKKILVNQVRSMEGKVTANPRLDETTRLELSNWLQDFVYRGGSLSSGREAPISRTNLVPPLQTLASVPDITWIPKIMRSKQWPIGAILMQEWLRAPSNIRPSTIELTPNNFGPPLLNVIKMDWVLGYSRAKAVYDGMLREKIWVNTAGKKQIVSMLKASGIVASALANPEKAVSFGNLDSSDVIKAENAYIQSRSCSNGIVQDDLAAALANFNFRVGVKGFATAKAGNINVTINEIGIYVKDSYDFINDGSFQWGCLCHDQPLGSWAEGVGSVSNDTFNNWRTANNKGGDFLIYSDIKTSKINPGDSFSAVL
jgi:hypothetical protein